MGDILITDEDCVEFLQWLDDHKRIEPTEFECKFIESNLDRKTFTAKQKDVVRSMVKKYSGDD